MAMCSLVTFKRAVCMVGKAKAAQAITRTERQSFHPRWKIADVKRLFMEGCLRNYGWKQRAIPLRDVVRYLQTYARGSNSRQLHQESSYVPVIKPVPQEGLQIHRGSSKRLLTSLIHCLAVDGVANVNGRSEPDQDYSFETTKGAALRARNTANGLLCFHCDHQVVELPPGHRFPMKKYRATRLVLESDRSLKKIITIHKAPQASIDELHRVHDTGYVKKVLEGKLSKPEQTKLGLPWSQSLVNRSLAAVGGTVAATHAVMSLGEKRLQATGMLAGGTHHAFPAHGEGFCVFNDIAVAAAICLDEYRHECNADHPVLILDLDVHQGNGTAAIFEGDSRVITFSMHGEKNYPWRSKMRSTYDVELEDECDDATYLKELSNWIPLLFRRHKPGLVFFQSGVDALKEDKFGRLALTREGLLRRNNVVYSACIAAGVPLVITMGGGYSNPSDYSVASHADVYRSAAYRFSLLQAASPS